MRKTFSLLALAIFATILSSCTQVPITGRRQLSLVDVGTVNKMASGEYITFLKQNKLSANAEGTASVKRVGARIAKAVEQFLRNEGMEDQIQYYQWEFNLVESKEVNAWAMPGGKVVVYEGILPITQDDAGMAVVIGHEIAHVVARHGGERLSQSLLVQFGGVALDVAMSSKPTQTRQIFMSAYGAGATVGVLLPFSRLQETEADRLGLIFMAMAGYDPRVAPDFWRRMSASQKGGLPIPEFLRTHPSDETRIENIEMDVQNEAMEYYRRSQKAPIANQPAPATPSAPSRLQRRAQ